MGWVIWSPDASEAVTWIVYAPDETFAVCDPVVPGEPPLHAEILVMRRSAPKQINAAAPFRYRLSGNIKRNPASAAPDQPVRRIPAVWVDSVKTESVKLAGVPPVIATFAGTKVHEALVGRLLHERLRLPEYPPPEVIVSP